MARVQRQDNAGTLRGVERTPQGGIRAPAALTRAGVLTYRDATGATWGELRHPDDVFAPDSLATLRGAPVTVDHPDEPVTTENYEALTVGHVGDSVERERDLVVAPVTVQAASAVKRVDAKELVEVSCGYSCDVVDEVGTYDGEAYTRRQKNITYNHVGLGKEGWGRAGSRVALRLDGAAVQVSVPAGAAKGTMKKIKINGREFTLDADAAVADAQGAADAQAAALAATEAALVAATKAFTDMKAAMGAEEITEDKVPEAVADKLVATRVALRTRAAKVLGADTKLDGKTATEIRALVIGKAFPTMKLDGLSADALAGVERAAYASAETRNDALDRAHDVATGGNGGSNADDKDPAAEARARTDSRWQQPTTISPRKGA